MTSSSAPVVLITGSARRVGAAIARHLHAAGYDIAIHYRKSGQDALALQADLELDRPDSTLCMHADLAEIQRLPELVAGAMSRFGNFWIGCF